MDIKQLFIDYLNNNGWNYDEISAFKNFKRFFWQINWLKTLYYNFKWVKFSDAIKLPIIIGYNVRIRQTGKITFKNKPIPAQISIGVERINGWEDSSQRTFFTNLGELCLHGRVKCHPGAKLVIQPKAVLELGNRVGFGANTKVICAKSITIGNNVRFSWECQIFDTDFHFLKKVSTGKVYKRIKPVIIGNNVFIGNRCSISKGTIIPDGSTISCCSKAEGDYSGEGEFLLIKGNPGSVVTKGFIFGSSWLPEEEKEIASQLEG